MALLGASSCNVVDSHRVSRLPPSHDVSLGPALLDIVNHHGITNEFRWCRWTHFDLRNSIVRVQRVVPLSLRLELDNLWLSALQIRCFQISLVLD